MKSTNRNARRIALAVCLSVSGLLPQTAIPMPTETQGKAVASPAHAHGWETLSPADRAYLFGAHTHGAAQPRMAYMTEEEMQRTEGKFGLAGAVVGAVGGASGYIGSTIGSGSGSVWGLAGATVSGAVGGFFLGPVSSIGANTILASQIGFYGGMLGGFVEKGCNSCHATRPDSARR